MDQETIGKLAIVLFCVGLMGYGAEAPKHGWAARLTAAVLGCVGLLAYMGMLDV